MGNTSQLPPLSIAVLGPVVIGDQQPRERAAGLISACSWFALHPQATGHQMDRALQLSPESQMSMLSRLRSWIGQDRLPLSRAGRYRIDACTDWEQFQALVCARSGRLRPDVTDDDLSAALAFVRGEPLADIFAPWADG